MNLRYYPQLRLMLKDGKPVVIHGKRGERRWREDMHRKYPKGSRAKVKPDHHKFHGGPWAGATVRTKEKDSKIRSGGVRIGLDLGPMADIRFSSEFDGWYELDDQTYRWNNPLTEACQS